MMTFDGSGPSAATIPSARRIAGNAKNTSMTRPTTRSAIPPKPRRAGALREADSGIQVAIQKVHNDVERDEEDRDREHSALNERVIALHDGRQEHATDP